jgi:hypothetical protein
MDGSSIKTSFVLLMLVISTGDRAYAVRTTANRNAGESEISNPELIKTRIVAEARSCVGKKMWTGYGLSTGYLGCAAAISNVLKKAGCTAGHSAAVTQLRNQLIASRCTREIVVRSGPKGLATRVQ